MVTESSGICRQKTGIEPTSQRHSPVQTEQPIAADDIAPAGTPTETASANRRRTVRWLDNLKSKRHHVQMYCPNILARTLSKPSRGSGPKGYAFGNQWQYHSRSDRHSKVACWGMTLDLLENCPLLRRHIQEGKVGLGINHELRDYRNGKKKNLDLVLCRAATGSAGGSKAGRKGAETFADLVAAYDIELSSAERSVLNSLPSLPVANVSSVLLAAEAKAAMTAFQKARPRLKDELTSSFQTIHGDNEHAIAAGIVMVNTAATFVSPDMNKFDMTQQKPVVSTHQQPRSAQLVVAGLKELQRRSKVGDIGFDGIGVVLIDCQNDGVTPVTVAQPDDSILPQTDDYAYGRFIDRLAQLYATRFSAL